MRAIVVVVHHNPVIAAHPHGINGNNLGADDRTGEIDEMGSLAHDPATTLALAMHPVLGRHKSGVDAYGHHQWRTAPLKPAANLCYVWRVAPVVSNHEDWRVCTLCQRLLDIVQLFRRNAQWFLNEQMLAVSDRLQNYPGVLRMRQQGYDCIHVLPGQHFASLRGAFAKPELLRCMLAVYSGTRYQDIQVHRLFPCESGQKHRLAIQPGSQYGQTRLSGYAVSRFSKHHPACRQSRRRIGKHNPNDILQLAVNKLDIERLRIGNGGAMCHQSVDGNRFLRHQAKKLFDISPLSPPRNADRKIDAIQFIDGVKRAESTRLGDNNFHFLVPHFIAVRVDIRNPQYHDTSLLAAEPHGGGYRLRRFCGGRNHHGIATHPAGPSRNRFLQLFRTAYHIGKTEFSAQEHF